MTPELRETEERVQVGTRFEDLVRLITSLQPNVVYIGNTRAVDVDEIDSAFGVVLPTTYRRFLLEYGSLSYESVRILGIDEASSDLSLFQTLILLRIVRPDFPQDLVPIEDLGSGWIACLRCPPSGDKRGGAPVVRLYLNGAIAEGSFTTIAPDFADYLISRLRQAQGRARGLQQLKKRVTKFNEQHEYDHAKGGKLPRNHEWRPYRYCIQDVVFGVTVVRHLREANCLQVDVFLTANVPEYDPLAGAQALAVFLLSEAYKCGGTMEIRFTKAVEGGQVPFELQELAARYGIRFGQPANGRISPGEAKALYAALTDFSPELREKIEVLEQAGKARMARACYVVNHGVWTKEQVEMIVLGSQRPDSVLGGLARPHQRHLYVHDLLHARAALLGGVLDRRLAKRERHTDDGTTYDLEDDVRALEISFDGVTCAKSYRCDEPVPVPWLYGGTRDLEIPAGIPFHVLVRARDVADMQLHLAADMRVAGQLRAQTGQPTFVVVPQDFATLPRGVIDRLMTQAQEGGIGFLVCPETITTFDADAAQRLARSRVLRQ